MSRDYPALELRWPSRPSDEHVERLLATIDDDAPTAVEERADGVRVFFVTAETRARAASVLRAADSDLTCTSLDVPDEDWAARSQASLGSVRIGNIVVAPREEDDVPGVVLIVIPPSMGFGTGHHASTRLCLQLLQDTAVTGARVLDVGTGSGVLAIAAWKLGAREVVAIDNDPDALTAARENLERNGADGPVRIEVADLTGWPGGDRDAARFDLVLANLTGTLLARQASTLAAVLGPGGRVIASGFQPDEAASITAAFAAAGLGLAARADESEWVGAIFTIPTASRAR